MKADDGNRAAQGPGQENEEVDENLKELYSKGKANKPLKTIEVSLSSNIANVFFLDI